MKTFLKNYIYFFLFIFSFIYTFVKLFKFIARCSLLLGAVIVNTTRETLVKCNGHLENHHNHRTNISALSLIILACTLSLSATDADCNTQEIIIPEISTCETLQDVSRSCHFYSTAEITLISSESCLWFTDKEKNHFFFFEDQTRSSKFTYTKLKSLKIERKLILLKNEVIFKYFIFLLL